MANKRIGKGIYLLTTLIFLLSGVYLFRTCDRKEKGEVEDIVLPVATTEPVLPEPEIPLPAPVADIPEKETREPEQSFLPLEDTGKDKIAAVEVPVEIPVEKVVEPVVVVTEEPEDNQPEEPVWVEPVVEDQPVATVPLPETKRNFDRGIVLGTFIPKGVWMVGGTFNYTETSANDMKFLVVRNIEGKAYTFSVAPTFAYFFRDNMGVGGRFTYSREHVNLGNMDINLNEDLTFKIDNAYLLEHMFYGTAFFRMYTPVFNSKIIGLFNEARITFGAGQGKTFSGRGESLDGLYQNIKRLQIGMSPGIAAFVTNDLALDISVGVLGFDTKWIKQDHNKIIQEKYNTSSGKFKIDLFSINLGLSYFF